MPTNTYTAAKAWQVSPNFNIAEFQSKDGCPVPDELECNIIALAAQLEIIREAVGEPLTILSGYRSPAHNKKVGGAKNSMHMQGKAADLTCKTKTPKQLHTLIEKLIAQGKLRNGGLGSYAGFTHFDIGDVRRWKG